MAETTVQSGLATRTVARFVAIGLFLMAFFTLLCASWSLYGLPVAGSIALVVIFSVIAVIFVINGVRLLRSADRLPVPTGDDSNRQGRAMRVGFGVTLAAVGVIIGVVCALLIVNGAYAYLAPAIVSGRLALHPARVHLSPDHRFLHRRLGRGVGLARLLADQLTDHGRTTCGIHRWNRRRVQHDGVRRIHVAGQAGDTGHSARIRPHDRLARYIAPPILIAPDHDRCMPVAGMHPVQHPAGRPYVGSRSARLLRTHCVRV